MKIRSTISDTDNVELELIKDGKLKASNDYYGYVNNKELYAEFCKYFEKKKEALSNGLIHPPLSEKIGAAIIQIAIRRCNSRQYIGYSNNWKEEMISHAIMTAAIRCHNFDPERSNNPFAYVTQVCNNAIIEQLKKEKKNLYVRYKSTEEVSGFHGEVDDNVNEADLRHHIEGNDATEMRRKYISDYEHSQFTNKKNDVMVDAGVLNFLKE